MGSIDSSLSKVPSSVPSTSLLSFTTETVYSKLCTTDTKQYNFYAVVCHRLSSSLVLHNHCREIVRLCFLALHSLQVRRH